MTLSVANNGLHGVGPGEAVHTSFSPSWSTSSEVALRNTTGLPDSAPTHDTVFSSYDSTISRRSVGRVDDLIAEHRRPVKLDRGYASLSESRYGEKGQKAFSFSETGESEITEPSVEKLKSSV